MSGWIDWAALGKILGVGLLAGAGLPALFAIGLRLVTSPADHVSAGGGLATAGSNGANALGSVRSSPIALVGGVLCFAVVLAAIGYGIFIVVDG